MGKRDNGQSTGESKDKSSSSVSAQVDSTLNSPIVENTGQDALSQSAQLQKSNEILVSLLSVLDDSTESASSAVDNNQYPLSQLKKLKESIENLSKLTLNKISLTNFNKCAYLIFFFINLARYTYKVYRILVYRNFFVF